MRWTEFSQLKLWIDYDRGALPRLTSHQRILYFRRRLHKVVLAPIHQLYQTIQHEPDSGAVLCFGTCICCSIEAVGKFYTGRLKKSSGANFRAFVEEFMSADFRRPLNTGDYTSAAWDHFRNGLAHGFTIKHGGFHRSSAYFQEQAVPGSSRYLWIDPGHFHRDFGQGVARFIARVKAAAQGSDDARNFQKAFKAVFIDGASKWLSSRRSAVSGCEHRRWRDELQSLLRRQHPDGLSRRFDKCPREKDERPRRPRLAKSLRPCRKEVVLRRLLLGHKSLSRCMADGG